jgi:rhodanese-related sulfurtransferase
MEKRREKVMGKRHKVVLFLALGTLLFTMGGRAAARTEVPRITNQELKGTIDQGASVVILDTRPRAIFEKGHIWGAISFPWKARITLQDVSGLPRDRLIVTYCSCGPGEADSANVAEQLVELGFRNVKVLIDPSIGGWKQVACPLQ